MRLTGHSFREGARNRKPKYTAGPRQLGFPKLARLTAIAGVAPEQDEL